MSLLRLILSEIGHRRLNFVAGVISVAAAVGCLVAQATFMHRFDQRTEAILIAKGAATETRLDEMENDYRKLTLKMGFNVIILPKDQNLGDLYAEDFAAKTMPEEYATRLARSRVATINHVLPSLQQKVKWPEQQRTILLMGVRGEVYIQSARQSPLLQAVSPGTMLVGHELARSLPLKPGDTTVLMGRRFTVDRVNPERGNRDDITIWINLAEAQELLGKPGQINAILALDCTCDTIDRLALIRAEIGRILPDTQVIEFASQAAARAEARQRAADETKAAMAAEKANRARLRAEKDSVAAMLVPVVLLGVAVWIGWLAFGNVRERITEIGILCALGLRSRQIMAIFLGRAATTGFLGALIGFSAGVWVARPALPDVQWPWLIAALAGAPILTLLAAWLPALAAARRDPASILRKA